MKRNSRKLGNRKKRRTQNTEIGNDKEMNESSTPIPKDDAKENTIGSTTNAAGEGITGQQNTEEHNVESVNNRQQYEKRKQNIRYIVEFYVIVGIICVVINKIQNGFLVNLMENIRVFYLKTLPSMAHSYAEADPNVFKFGSGDWASFFGSYLGGIIVGLATLIVVVITIVFNILIQNAKAREEKQERIRKNAFIVYNDFKFVFEDIDRFVADFERKRVNKKDESISEEEISVFNEYKKDLNQFYFDPKWIHTVAELHDSSSFDSKDIRKIYETYGNLMTINKTFNNSESLAIASDPLCIEIEKESYDCQSIYSEAYNAMMKIRKFSWAMKSETNTSEGGEDSEGVAMVKKLINEVFDNKKHLVPQIIDVIIGIPEWIYGFIAKITNLEQ